MKMGVDSYETETLEGKNEAFDAGSNGGGGTVSDVYQLFTEHGCCQRAVHSRDGREPERGLRQQQ